MMQFSSVSAAAGRAAVHHSRTRSSCQAMMILQANSERDLFNVASWLWSVRAHSTAATAAAVQEGPSIFERIPRPPPVMSSESLDLFQQLASPSDVPLQFSHAAMARIRDRRTWEMLSASAVRALRHMKVSEVAVVLQSCAQASWRDEHLIVGLAEALRCGAELRRGTVRDYALCCQSLRRLGYCPWAGALRAIVRELHWRLYRQRWRPMDLVYTLRFLAEFDVHRVPKVLHAGALVQELKEIAEARLGEMRHLELAHFGRALARLGTTDGTPDIALIERIADNFSRRADDLPMSALFHMAATLMKVHAPAPQEFLEILSSRARADLSQLKPFEITFLAAAAARFQLQDAALLKSLGLAVAANLDSFSATQIALVAESLDLLNFRHRSLQAHMVKVLFSSEYKIKVSGKARSRMVASLIVAASTQSTSMQKAAVLHRCTSELAGALSAATAKAVTPNNVKLALEKNVGEQVKSPTRASSLRPPDPVPLPPRRRKSAQKRKQAGSATEAPESIGKPLFSDDMAGQLQALRDIEGSLTNTGTDKSADLQLPTDLFPGVRAMSEGRKRRSRSGHELRVPSFAPAGATIVKPRSARQQQFQRLFGGRHPAARRIHRRILQLEKELKLNSELPASLVEKMPRPKKSSTPKSAQAHRALTLAKASILWRRLRRYRLSGFQAEHCAGKFVSPTSELDITLPRRAGASLGHVQHQVLELEHMVILCESLASSEGLAVPGRDALLRDLAAHCTLWATPPAKERKSQGAFLALTRIGAAMCKADVPSPALLQCMEAHLPTALPLRPRALQRTFVVYATLARLDSSDPYHVRPDCTVSRLLGHLLAESAPKPGLRSQAKAASTGVALWTLSAEEVAAVLVSLASLVRSPSQLEPRWQARLRRGLRAYLNIDPLAGSTPPRASAIASLAASWIWVVRAQGMPSAVGEVCKRWAISPSRVSAIVAKWRTPGLQDRL